MKRTREKKAKMLRRAMAVFAVCFCTSSANAQNLLMDPSFDASTPESQTNPSWNLDTNMPDGLRATAQFQDAPWASNPLGTPGIGVWMKPFEGETGGELAMATLWQEVAAPAGTYDVSFYYRKETNYTAENTFVELLEDGTRIGIVDLTDADTANDFAQFSFDGVSSGGTLRVQATMLNGIDSGANPQSAMFDDFSLTAAAIPEPSSIGLLALGLVGIASRRRRLAA